MSARHGTYEGPACPHCRHLFADGDLHDGSMRCPACTTAFEARVFHPPQRSARVLQVAESGPESATACANHARNVAVASCDRCGLLICSLCQLDVGGTTYCPSCFERLSQEGAIATAKNRMRDYGNLAIVWAAAGVVFSIFFLGIPLGILSLYYSYRALRSRENRGSIVSVIVAVIFALGVIAFGLFYFYSLFQVTRGRIR